MQMLWPADKCCLPCHQAVSVGDTGSMQRPQSARCTFVHAKSTAHLCAMLCTSAFITPTSSKCCIRNDTFIICIGLVYSTAGAGLIGLFMIMKFPGYCNEDVKTAFAGRVWQSHSAVLQLFYCPHNQQTLKKWRRPLLMAAVIRGQWSAFSIRRGLEVPWGWLAGPEGPRPGHRVPAYQRVRCPGAWSLWPLGDLALHQGLTAVHQIYTNTYVSSPAARGLWLPAHGSMWRTASILQRPTNTDLWASVLPTQRTK